MAHIFFAQEQIHKGAQGSGIGKEMFLQRGVLGNQIVQSFGHILALYINCALSVCIGTQGGGES